MPCTSRSEDSFESVLVFHCVRSGGEAQWIWLGYKFPYLLGPLTSLKALFRRTKLVPSCSIIRWENAALTRWNTCGEERQLMPKAPPLLTGDFFNREFRKHIQTTAQKD